MLARLSQLAGSGAALGSRMAQQPWARNIGSAVGMGALFGGGAYAVDQLFGGADSGDVEDALVQQMMALEGAESEANLLGTLADSEQSRAMNFEASMGVADAERLLDEHKAQLAVASTKSVPSLAEVLMAAGLR